jgi:hypothetical protein
MTLAIRAISAFFVGRHVTIEAACTQPVLAERQDRSNGLSAQR